MSPRGFSHTVILLSVRNSAITIRGRFLSSSNDEYHLLNMQGSRALLKFSS